jgi:hypothetical protein
MTDNPLKFNTLKVGDSFDFISGWSGDSFFKRCTKVSAKRYRDEDGALHTVGTIYVFVYHVVRAL